MSRTKYWENPKDLKVCTEIMYSKGYLYIKNRESGEWREPTPAEAYFHFKSRKESLLRKVAEVEVNCLKAELRRLREEE